MESSNHEVFISFRGEDTRWSFTSHLYAALSRLKIKTYIDNNLQRGEEIPSALIKAIEGSKISVVVFSERYAGSVWCLDELVKIIECKRYDKQVIVPIFYGVDPETVRHQTGKYADHFSKHKKRYNLQVVENWRAALAESANLSGWDSSVHRTESELVDGIANDILQKLDGVGLDYDLASEMAMRERMAQHHEEEYLRTRDVIYEIANDMLQMLHVVGPDDDLASEIAMCERMAQHHEEEYLRTRDVNHWHDYKAMHRRIAQLENSSKWSAFEATVLLYKSWKQESEYSLY